MTANATATLATYRWVVASSSPSRAIASLAVPTAADSLVEPAMSPPADPTSNPKIRAAA